MKIYKARFIITGIFTLLVLISAFFIPSIRFNFDFESLFPVNDPDLFRYQQFREKFEPDDNFLVVAIENEPHIFDKKFLTAVDSFSRQAAELPYVEEAQS